MEKDAGRHDAQMPYTADFTRSAIEPCLCNSSSPGMGTNHEYPRAQISVHQIDHASGWHLVIVQSVQTHLHPTGLALAVTSSIDQEYDVIVNLS